MFDFEYYDQLMRQKLSQKRYLHCVGTMDTAVLLAKKYNADQEKARLAGLVHDITKEETFEKQLLLCEKYSIIITKLERETPKLLHQYTGACYVRYELGVADEDIFNSIYFHTTGSGKMSLLQKIIYVADFIEPARNFAGVDEIRALAERDLDKALLKALDVSLLFLIEDKLGIHSNTINARNEMIEAKISY